MRKRWSDLSERERGFIVVASVFDGIAKIAALVDLSRRSEEEIRGSKRLWATVILLVNSVGAVPLAYFLLARRTPDTD
ncbi:DUF5652 family protein [Nocardia arizonensis]|uniref:DUF5652 family protein n=1 Tax=Nocardia arizonensis TaxID=1141647 RepID=UPI00194E7E52|nr:DUF5652 family protein [Nocardia arizonensis]